MKMKYLLWQLNLLVTISFVAYPSLLLAQPRDLRFERLSRAQGLVGGEVHCIVQDSFGYLWFGTESGLNRYDGTGFTVYRHEPRNSSSIVDAKVQSLWEDTQGILWVGTWNGLERFNRASDTFTHFLPDPEAPPGDWSNVIYDIREDRSGTLWLAGKGLKSFDRSTGMVTLIRHDDGTVADLVQNNVDAVYEDAAGELWLGTAGALERFDRSTGKYTQYWVDDNIRKGMPPDFFGFHWIQKIYEDRTGVLWLCTNRGPVAFNRKTGKFRAYHINRARPDSSSAHSVSSILEDDSGVLWIGTWGAGLMTYDPGADDFVSVPLHPSIGPSQGVCALYKDRAGTLWIGTNGDGVLKLEKKQKRFTAFRHDPPDFAEALDPIPAVTSSLQHNDVRFLYEGERGIVAIGTASGLDQFDRKKGVFAHWASWDWPYSITGILRSRFVPVIWTGTEGDGFSKIQERPYRRTTFSTREAGLGGSACSLFEDRRGVIWMLVSDAGVCQIDPKTEKFKNLGIGQSQPFVSARMIVEDSVDATENGWVLWIGTGDGLWKYDARSDAFSRFGHDPKDPTSLASNAVTTVFRDSHGTIWVGTDRGLSRLDSRTGTFETFAQANGLPDRVVLGILEDDQDRLWVSTPKSISKFGTRTRYCTSYSMGDVLPDVRFSAGCCLRMPDGEMYFGGLGGFVVFHPDSIRDNPYVPPIAITGFNKFDKPAALDSTILVKKVIELSHTENIFSFEFVALNFVHPERNQYAYTLDGHDSTWTYCGNAQYARYVNVEPGEYTFRVKGSNDDGLWNEEGASIAVIISPPLWARRSVQGFALVALLAAVGALIRYVEKRKLMRKIEQLEHETALERERARISRDMHDEVGSSLSEIVILSQLAKRKPQEAGSHVEEISERASGLIDSVSEIVWAMNPDNDALDNLVAHIRYYGVRYLGLAEIPCRFHAPETVRPIPVPSEKRRNVFLVVKEALHNIVKHSGDTEVSITVTCEAGGVNLRIEDNGCGFVVNELLGTGNGLTSMMRRIDEIGGTLDVKSEPGSGAKISFAVPLAQQPGSAQDRS